MPAASRRRYKKPEQKLNLVPIMDSVFIFIFFLLMSANFIKIMEIGSDIPIISETEPPKDKKDPLALSLKIERDQLVLTRGLDPRIVGRYPRNAENQYDLIQLHQDLVTLKKQHTDEQVILFEPIHDLTYDEMILIMDSVRMLQKTDEAIFIKNKEGIDEKSKDLFPKIIFTNLMS